jgi:hypothetical protein
MIEPTDIHAMRRVSRMFGRMLAEAEHHVGHGETCPFVRHGDDMFFTKEALDTLVEQYEREHGPVALLFMQGSQTPVA